MAPTMITADEVRRLLDYDPETGVFTWRVTLSDRTPAGSVAGSSSSGYRRVCICRRYYMAHRLAWLYVHGVWPPEEVDHINRVRNDNRISNLRLVSRSENAQNVGLKRTNTSGVTGVNWHAHSKKWRAAIRVPGVKLQLGVFSCFAQAVRARRAAETTYHPYRQP